MSNKRKNRGLYFGWISLCIFMISCSTTKKLNQDEVLYVGVEKMEIQLPEHLKLNSTQSSGITEPLSVKPNNPLYAPYLRSPFATGLWVYNWNIEREKGIKWWLYRKLAKKPVLISDVQPELRLKMVENQMEDYGFYGVQSHYEVLPKKRNPQKAYISYWVTLPEPLRYGTIQLWGWKEGMDSIVQASMRFSELKTGDRYDVNILNEERQRISDRLRNQGYYFFQPDYIEFLVDTLSGDKIANVRIALKKGIPDMALYAYTIRNVEVILSGNTKGGDLDSVLLDQVKIYYEQPVALKPDILVRAVKMRPGQTYSAFRQRWTQTNFVQLGVFKYANMAIVPDTVKEKVLDIQIHGEFSLPIEAEIEMDVSSKSNNLLGPGLTLGLTHQNMFKRAGSFGVRLNGSYEWQMGGKQEQSGDKGLINSYELGVNVSLSFPRLLLPKFLASEKERREQTHFQIGADFLNRHNYFRMISFSGSAVYDFNTSFRNYHSVVPFRLNYNYMLQTSVAFDSVTMRNPAVAQGFQNQFIPAMAYTYTYDRPVSYRNPNRLFWQTSVMEAGNLISALHHLWGNEKGEGKKILNNRYSQFLKLTSELILYKTIDRKNQLAMRFMGGVGYAYGNSNVMPYSEQFYIGGSNSIRAFQIRSIGPGSYHPEETQYSYLDQTGDLKLEGNLEYRFKIYEQLHGALFVDAGNIWLLKKEEQRPGGVFEIKNFLKELALGTGFGVRYDFSYLVLRMDLGIPLHAPYATGKSSYYNISGNLLKNMVLNFAIGYPF